jgi:hypothetical protein
MGVIEAIYKALNIESTWFFALIIGLGGFMVFGFLGLVVGAAYKNSPEYKAEWAARHPNVEASYDLQSSALPIRVAPGGVINAVVFSRNKTGNMIQVTNSEKTEYEWPFKTGKLLRASADTIKVTNNSNQKVFDIVIPLKFNFYENVPGQTNAVITASNSGDWVINSIAPGESAIMYLINKTHLVVITVLPIEVPLGVQGIKSRVNVPLMYRQISMQDLPMVTSGPSVVDWTKVD